MRLNNKGLSLAEIMVTVAIIAVVLSVGIMGVNTITGRPAQQSAQKVVYSLERHRMTAMSKVDASYTLRVDGSGRVVCDEFVSNNGAGSTTTSEIGTKQVKVSYVCNNGSIYDLASAPLTLRFDRSSGAFKPLADGSYCSKIILKSGGRTFEVTLVPLTGKVYID